MAMQTGYQRTLSVLLFTGLVTGGVLSPRAATAATYYVATTGSDANPGSQSQPFQTIDRGMSVLRAGDTLYLRGGTYTNQPIGPPSAVPVPSGTSWSNAITIAGYPGETVILSGRCITFNDGSPVSYVIFDNLICDATTNGGAMYIGGDSHHIRFQNGEMDGDKNTSGAAMMISGSGPYLEILNSTIHGAGGNKGQGCTDPFGCYAAYYAGHHALFDNNVIYESAGYALHIFNSSAVDVSDNIVRNNVFYGNGFVDVRPILGYAILLSCGSNNEAYNNIVYENAGGIQVDFRCTNCLVYNNTVYNNPVLGAGIHIGPTDVVGTRVHNNILYGNAGTIINWSDPTAVLANNLCDVAGPGCSVVGNPLFVNAAAGDFHLQPSSPAIDAGNDAVCPSSDQEGQRRVSVPGGGTSICDIGALEFRPASPSPPPIDLKEDLKEKIF
jgi:parallel beta-helix repeat protein